MSHLKLKHLVITSLALFAGVMTYSYYTTISKQSTDDKHPPEIILIAIPKSGSKYLLDAIQTNLGCTRVKFSDKNCELINMDGSAWVNYAPFVLKEHYLPPLEDHDANILQYPALDLKILKKNGNKMVLHLRDPRQVLLSLIHHIHVYGSTKFITQDERKKFLKLSFEKQVDWAIANILPKMLLWMQSWLDFKELEDARIDGVKILVTTYDELIADERALYHKILNFFDVTYQANSYVAPPKDESTHYRKGDPKEWRVVYSNAQKQKIAAMIPESLLDRFGWDKNY